MKKYIEKIAISLIMVMMVVSCGLFKKACKEKDVQFGTSMMNSYVMNASKWQVDSICTADTLPSLDKWIINQFKDYETGEYITKYMYIKSLGKDEIVYIIIGESEPYKVQRRITK
jgi:hypothetical protein